MASMRVSLGTLARIPTRGEVEPMMVDSAPSILEHFLRSLPDYLGHKSNIDQHYVADMSPTAC